MNQNDPYHRGRYTSAPPLFRGMWVAPSRSTEELGMEKYEGGPRKWEAHTVHHENGQQLLMLPVFSHSFFLNPPLTPVTLTLPAPPPPSRPNVSWMWFFFSSFNASTTTTTSLASNRKPEVVLLSVSMCLPPPPPPSHQNMSRRWIFSMFRCVYRRHPLPHIQM